MPDERPKPRITHHGVLTQGCWDPPSAPNEFHEGINPLTIHQEKPAHTEMTNESFARLLLGAQLPK